MYLCNIKQIIALRIDNRINILTNKSCNNCLVYLSFFPQHYPREYSNRDVLIVSDLFGGAHDLTIYNNLLRDASKINIFSPMAVDECGGGWGCSRLKY